MDEPARFLIDSLGPREVPTPLKIGGAMPGEEAFVSDSERLVLPADESGPERRLISFELPGPRERVFFRPEESCAAIVTCGGLSPGLNDVIRAVYMQLHFGYGVSRIIGVRYGYHGFRPDSSAPPIELTHEVVSGIHKSGGSILGSSRGPVSPEVIVDFLTGHGVNLLFTVGGDGTQRGALQVVEEIRRRGLQIAVVGIPKTIDDDILYVTHSFGYVTAVERAMEILDCAHVEAKGSHHGISIVKLMGRDAGFITVGAALASQDANFVLIPEVPFRLEGENGFLSVLQRRILAHRHAVIAVAEGAGQDLFAAEEERRDASGNVLHHDIGLYLRDRVAQHFRERGIPVNLRYFDPSYYIRSVPAEPVDSITCDRFARHAVHAAMAGKTGLVIGRVFSKYVHVPIPEATARRKKVDPRSQDWLNVLSVTGQPPRMM